MFRWLIGQLVILLLVTAMVLGAVFWTTNALLNERVIDTIVSEVQGLREQYRVGGAQLLVATVDERSRLPGSSLYLLADQSRRKLAGNLVALPPGFDSATANGTFQYSRPGDIAAPPRTAAGVLIAVPDGLTLFVGRDIEDQRQLAVTTRNILLAGLGLISLIGLVGGAWASSRILGRVEAVRVTSERIVAGKLSERVPVTGDGTELDRLAVSLNSMLDRIEQLMAGLTEVSDNIAHDLKTPLSRLRGHAEKALREAPQDGAVPRQALEAIIVEADELIGTFNALLGIARLEAGTNDITLQVVDLAPAVRDAAELYEPLVEEAGLKLVLAVTDGLLVRGDRQLIAQAVTNLIDNAIKYAMAGSVGSGQRPAPAIEVTVSRRGATAILAVADHGPGIPAADRDRALKRFVRLDPSRSTVGSGLGLSLVAAVVKFHSGTIELLDNRPGLRVEIALPLVPAPGGTA